MNPSVYSHPITNDPVLKPPTTMALSVLGGKKANVDMTSSGAFFDPKAVNRANQENGGRQGTDMISQLTREMKRQQEHMPGKQNQYRKYLSEFHHNCLYF